MTASVHASPRLPLNAASERATNGWLHQPPAAAPTAVPTKTMSPFVEVLRLSSNSHTAAIVTIAETMAERPPTTIAATSVRARRPAGAVGTTGRCSFETLSMPAVAPSLIAARPRRTSPLRGPAFAAAIRSPLSMRLQHAAYTNTME